MLLREIDAGLTTLKDLLVYKCLFGICCSEANDEKVPV